MLSEIGASNAKLPSLESVIRIGIYVCFLLSGFAALVYQLAWLRMFATVFGTSESAIAAVLAAYMGGLSLGAAIAGRIANRISRPVRTFGLIEAGIGLGALLVPMLLGLSAEAFSFFIGSKASPPDSFGFYQIGYYLLSGFLVISIPTVLMGASLPILAKFAVTSDAVLGKRVGSLYAVNSLGAATGALAAGFLLIPNFGLLGTTLAAVGVNLTVFLIAVVLLSLRVPSLPDSANSESGPHGQSSQMRWVLPVICVCGITSFSYEVLWTRLLSHVLGGTIFSFSTMLASFLAGIAIGSYFARPFSKTRDLAMHALVVTQIGVAVASIVVYQCVLSFSVMTIGIQAKAALALFALLPAAVFMGATFPLAVRILSNDETRVAQSSAAAYSWNTIGAIIGAVLCGFVLIPELEYEGTLKAIVFTNTLLAAYIFVWLRPQKRIPALASLSVLLLVALLFNPERPGAIVKSSLVVQDSVGNEIFYAVGRSATVLVEDQEEGFQLRTNGLPEALVRRRGAPVMALTQRWLSALPLLARPEAKEMLMVGLGGGVALEILTDSLVNVDVIELEAAVITANLSIAQKRSRNPLDDSRINLVVNDARNALAATTKTYDVIVSQPSHPWTSGSSHLYTREFVALSKSRLNPGGVFVQWISTDFVTESLLSTVSKTLIDAFDNVEMFQPSPNMLIFLSSDKVIEFDRADANFSVFSYMGINLKEDILAFYRLDSDGVKHLARGARPNTDNHNVLGTTPYSELGLSQDDLDTYLSSVSAEVPSVFHRQGEHAQTYILYRQLLAGMNATFDTFLQALESPDPGELAITLRMTLEGNPSAAGSILSRLHRRDPLNRQVSYALIRPHLASLARQQAPQLVREAVLTLDDSAAAVVLGWKYALESDWEALRVLDSRLAASQTTDLWFPEATRLRVQWRLAILSHNEVGQLTEAMTLLETAMAVYELSELDRLYLLLSARLKEPWRVLEISKKLVVQDADDAVLHYIRRQFAEDYMSIAEKHFRPPSIRY